MEVRERNKRMKEKNCRSEKEIGRMFVVLQVLRKLF